MRVIICLLAACLALAAQDVIIRGPASMSGPQMHAEFIAVEVAPGKVVKGAPYSAEAVTETTQTLADGNRIQHKNTAMLYRDSQGRTRREQTLSGVGPFAAASEPLQTIFISDPVVGVSYHLESRSKTARKVPPPAAMVKARAKPGEAEVFERKIVIEGESAEAQHQVEARFVSRRGSETGKTESLGKRMIEGLEAEGTRTLMTIPAGQIGNERPIEIVSERWYSPQLQVVVYSKRNDPRFGETTYRLVNTSRSEPLASLFQVPPDYTVKESPQVIRHVKTEVK